MGENCSVPSVVSSIPSSDNLLDVSPNTFTLSCPVGPKNCQKSGLFFPKRNVRLQTWIAYDATIVSAEICGQKRQTSMLLLWAKLLNQ